MFSMVGGRLLAVILFAGTALAQSSASYSDVPDTFRLEAGGFRIGANTQLTYNQGGEANPPVDFESLKVPDSTARFYLEGFWRPWRRHQFSLSWYQNNRNGAATPVPSGRDLPSLAARRRGPAVLHGCDRRCPCGRTLEGGEWWSEAFPFLADAPL